MGWCQARGSLGTAKQRPSIGWFRPLLALLHCVVIFNGQPCRAQTASSEAGSPSRPPQSQPPPLSRLARLSLESQRSAHPSPPPLPPSKPRGPPPWQGGPNPPPHPSLLGPTPPPRPRLSPPSFRPPPPPPPLEAGMYPPDAAILLEARKAWGGGEEGVLRSWAANRPCAQWEGVVCDAAGRVTQLSLRSYGLSGGIPPGLGKLIQLQNLDLGSNQLARTIPSSFGALSRLTKLNLGSNQLSGTIPSALGKLTQLRELYLSSNSLTGSLPLSMGNLVQLQYLYLYSNQLSGALPSAISRLSELRSLDLSSNQLNGSLPLSITDLTALQELRLSSNQLSGSLPSTIGNLNGLQYVSLSFNGLSGSLPSSIGNLTSLQDLRLSGNRLTGSLPISIGNLHRLQYLIMPTNSLSGSLPSTIGKLSALQSIDLSSNQLSGSLPNTIGYLSELQFLRLTANQLSGSLPSSIGSLRRLQVIGASSNQLSGSLPFSIGKLSVLEYLGISSNQLSGFLPPSIGNLTKLEHLFLSYNDLAGSLPSSIGNLKALQHLYLSSNRLSGSLPNSLSSLSALRDLRASSNELSGTLPKSIGNLVALQYLRLSENALSGSLPSTIGTLSGLQYLYLSYNMLTGSLPASLAKLTGFLDLRLSYNQLTGHITSGVSKMLLASRNADLSNNYFSGSCPSVELFFTLGGNCFQSCDESLPVASPEVCALACGSDQPTGPCQGRGTCYLTGQSLTPSCACNRGFVRPKWNPATCTRPKAAAPPPPPPFTVVGGVYPPDAAVLLAAIKFWGKARLFASWDPKRPCSEWEGLVCDATGRVVRLDLRSYRLSGIIPGSLGSLAALRELDLTYNKLSGSLPSGLGNLQALQKLALTSNRLSGSLPESIGKLTALTFLSIRLNELSGSLPATIGNLRNLQELVLSSNRLSGSLPSTIGNLIHLQYLRIPENQLSGSLPSTIGNLMQLQYLSLHSNRLSGSLPSTVGSLSELQYLILYYNQLSGSVPASIGSLSKLLYLSLNYNQLSGSLPESMGHLTRLESLYLSSNQLSGSLPSSLGNLSKLQFLYLMSNQLSGSLPSELGRLSGLQFLALSSNVLSGSLPSSLGNMSSLGSIDLSSNRLTGSIPAGVITLVSRRNGDLRNNFLSGGSCPPPILFDALQHNCFPISCGGSVGSQEGCSYACGSDRPSGPCQGLGNCLFVGPNKVPTCFCNPGFVNNASDPGTCVPAPAVAPPPPPRPQLTVTQGVSFLELPLTRALNRWSRYLSCNYAPQGGFPSWFIRTGSFWTAPPSAFLKPPSRAAASGVLEWASTWNQGACAACWAVVATDAVAAAQTIATSPAGGHIPALSLPQVLQCSANSVLLPANSTQLLANSTPPAGSGETAAGCSGGYPTTALEYAARSALLRNPSFQEGSSCSNIPPPPAIIMYEAVQFRGWFGLLLTLQKQPALVILEAGAPFQSATCVKNLVFQDPSCYSGSLDHSVVVVGYDIATVFPYWVVRNSWGDSWCNNGYMRVAIQGGAGVCGMNVLPAYYPVAAPIPGDPCYRRSSVPNGDSAAAMNPCGGGTCKAAPKWGSYSYTCTCPADFVAVNNTVRVTLPGAGQGITQSCAPVDACGLSLTNPCTVGTCVNDGAGSYSCLCPIGYFSNTTADGQSTCSIGRAPPQLVVQPGMTCCLISATYNITTEELLSQNPGLDCSALRAGQVVNASNPSFSCAVAYTVPSDNLTFDDVAETLRPKALNIPGVSGSDLKALNPSATCSADGSGLVKGQVICLRPGPWQGPPTCNNLHTMKDGDTCTTVTDNFFNSDPISFYGMNPGIDCGAISNPAPGADSRVGASGLTVCVGSEPVGARRCPALRTVKNTFIKAAMYIGSDGDTCAYVLSRSCKKFKDKALFSANAFLNTNRVPDCSNVKGFQFCCPA